MITCAADGGVALWRGGGLVASAGIPSSALCVGAMGPIAALVGTTSGVFLWDYALGRAPRALGGGTALHLAVLDHSTALVAHATSVALYDVRVAAPIVNQWKADPEIVMTAFHGGILFAAGGTDGAEKFDVRVKAAVASIDAPSVCMQFDRSGYGAVVGTNTGVVSGYRWASTAKPSWVEAPPTPTAVTALQVVSKDMCGVGFADGTMVVIRDGRRYASMATHGMTVNDIWMDSFRVVSGSADGSVAVHSTSGKIRYALQGGAMKRSAEDKGDPKRPGVSRVVCTDSRIIAARNSLLRCYVF